MSENGMLTVQPLSGIGTLLTIEKYDVYQSERYAEERAEERAEEQRYKNIEDRRQNEESKSPADAGMPSAEASGEPGPPIGSPEWYAAHENDEWEDDE